MKSSKEKRALIAGMIGCLLYVIGDFLFAATGKTQGTESIGLMVKVAYLDMATWRMGVSIICGVLGTALYGKPPRQQQRGRVRQRDCGHRPPRIGSAVASNHLQL